MDTMESIQMCRRLSQETPLTAVGREKKGGEHAHPRTLPLLSDHHLRNTSEPKL